MVDLAHLETLRYRRDGDVATLTLDRPDRLNSFTLAMWDEMREVGEVLANDDSLRVLVVNGAGRAFSSGIDTAEFGGAFLGIGSEAGGPGGSAPGTGDGLVDVVLRTQRAYSWLADAPFATVASVKGYALGAGLQCALACDIRVVARGTQLGLLELNWGIIPDLGGTQRLPRLVGPGKAKEMIFTAAKIDAEEAYRIGLVEQICDEAELDATTDALVDRLAAQPPIAIRGAKRAVAAAGRPIEEGLAVEAEMQARCLRSDDMKEAITAVLEGRAPEYRGH